MKLVKPFVSGQKTSGCEGFVVGFAAAMQSLTLFELQFMLLSQMLGFEIRLLLDATCL